SWPPCQFCRPGWHGGTARKTAANRRNPWPLCPHLATVPTRVRAQRQGERRNVSSRDSLIHFVRWFSLLGRGKWFGSVSVGQSPRLPDETLLESLPHPLLGPPVARGAGRMYYQSSCSLRCAFPELHSSAPTSWRSASPRSSLVGRPLRLTSTPRLVRS